MIFIPIIIILGILLSETLKKNQNNKAFWWLKITEVLGMDLRALALFRISLGLTLIYDLVIRLKDLTEHYTDLGIVPRSVLENTFPYNAFPYIYMITGSSVGTIILFSIHILLAIFLILGLYTKFVTPLVWYFTISLHLRNLLVCFGGDVFLHVLFFWAMFLPLGDKWSLDSFLTKKEEKDNSKSILSFGTIALTLQIAILYIISTEHKYSPEWRDDGSAVYYALSYDLYLRPLGKIIYDLHMDGLLKLITISVYWLERVGPFFLFCPIYTSGFRLLVILLIVLMHIGINLCLNVGYFGLVSCIAMIPFLPTIYLDKFCSLIQNNIKVFPSILNDFLNPIKVKYGNKLIEPDIVPLELKNILISLCFYYVCIQNLANIQPKTFIVPKEFSHIAKVVFLEQNWGMFTPASLKSNWWLVMPGKLKDGSIIDVFKQGKLDWEKPFLVEETFKSYRTSVYLNNLFAYSSNWHTNLSNYGDFLCTNWNSKHDKKKALKEFEVYYIFEDNLRNYKSGFPQRRLCWKHFCGMDKNERDKMWEIIQSNVDLSSSNCNITDSLSKLKENLNYLDKRLGKDHPGSIQCLIKLGECYRILKKYKEAEDVYKKIVYIAEKNLGENQLFTISIYSYLSDVLLKEGKIEESEKMKELITNQLKRVSEENYPFYLESIKKYSDEIDTRDCTKAVNNSK